MKKLIYSLTLAIAFLGLAACAAEPRAPVSSDEVLVSSAEIVVENGVESVIVDDAEVAEVESSFCPVREITMIWNSVPIKHTINRCDSSGNCHVETKTINEKVSCVHLCFGTCNLICGSYGNTSTTWPYPPGPGVPKHQGHGTGRPPGNANQVIQGEQCSPEGED